MARIQTKHPDTYVAQYTVKVPLVVIEAKRRDAARRGDTQSDYEHHLFQVMHGLHRCELCGCDLSELRVTVLERMGVA